MNNVFKERLERLMRENNINQLGLAETIGVTQSTLSRNINGIHRPKAEIIEKLANFFNVSTDYLLGKSNERNAPVSTPAPKEQLEGVKLALFDQVGDLSDDEARQVLDIIKIIKGDKK